MNKIEFLSELRHKLRRLPQYEIENAVSYYEEYFNDAGPQNEHQVIKDLGMPSSVAAKIIGEYAITDAEVGKKKSKDSSSLLVVLLAVLASPIMLPLALSLIIIIIALFIVLLSLFLSGVIVVISGIAAIAAGVWALMSSFATGIFFIGAGLLVIAIGLALADITIRLSKGSYWGLQKTLGKLLIRSAAK